MTSDFDPAAFGAVGNGVHLDSPAIQQAIDAAEKNGGGRVVLRSGKVYVAGSLILKSNVCLHVEGGSLLQCSKNWEHITERWPKGMAEPADRAQVHSGMFLTTKRGTKNVSITGTGIIDGAGEHFRGPDRGTTYEIVNERPFLLFFIGVEGITITDVTLRESSCWTVRLSGCTDIAIRGIRIRGNLRLPNCDGIDLDNCRRARISDCDIICADDGVSLKSCVEFAEYGGCEDVVVSNCIFTTKSSALVVGVEGPAPIRNVTFTNCIVRGSNRGCSVNLGEESLFENILFNNIIIETRVWGHQWWGRGEPIYVSTSPWYGDKIGYMRNVRFSNILCRSECGVYIAADKIGNISNVVLDNVQVELGKWSDAIHPEEQPGFYDRRPSSYGPGIYRPKERVAGFHLENVPGLVIKNSQVTWTTEDEAKCYGNAVWSRGCKGLLCDVGGEAAHADLPAQDIDNIPFDPRTTEESSEKYPFM